MKKTLSKLLEANSAYMTPFELKLKDTILKLLKDDGAGHHHSAYAARLKDYILNIVPLRVDPNFTAAVSFEDGIIYVGEGLIINEEQLKRQLPTIIRHELAHDLMLHEIRMVRHISDLDYSHIKVSQSFHQLLNTIADFEISNKKYNDYDKNIVRSIWLNGKIISGLVTEDSRLAWKDLTLEEMYDQLSKEIDYNQRVLLKDKNTLDKLRQSENHVDQTIRHLYIYNDSTSPTEIMTPMKNFIGSTSYLRLPETVQEIISAIFESWNILLDDANKDKIRAQIDKITKSAPNKSCEVRDPQNKVFTTLYTPEEKLFAIETFKNLLTFESPYTEWYEKVRRVLDSDEFSVDDINYILKNI